MAQKKRKIRELAMQVLFVWDSNAAEAMDLAGQVVSDLTDDPDIRRAALDMARAAWEQRLISDQWVERLAPQWPTSRQPPVDRNLLRLAIWELTAGVTPPKVVLDEVIELAKHFSTEQSPSFINGVLDAVLKEHQMLVGIKETGVRHQEAGAQSSESPESSESPSIPFTAESSTRHPEP